MRVVSSEVKVGASDSLPLSRDDEGLEGGSVTHDEKSHTNKERCEDQKGEFGNQDMKYDPSNKILETEDNGGGSYSLPVASDDENPNDEGVTDNQKNRTNVESCQDKDIKFENQDMRSDDSNKMLEAEDNNAGGSYSLPVASGDDGQEGARETHDDKSHSNVGRFEDKEVEFESQDMRSDDRNKISEAEDDKSVTSEDLRLQNEDIKLVEAGISVNLEDDEADMQSENELDDNDGDDERTAEDRVGRVTDEVERSEVEDLEEICSWVETNYTNAEESDDSCEEDESDNECDTSIDIVSYGDSGPEHLSQCEHCKNFYRTVNATQHKESCPELHKKKKQSEIGEDDSAPEAGESETEKMETTDAEPEPHDDEKPFTDLIRKGTEAANKSKDGSREVNVSGPKSKRKGVRVRLRPKEKNLKKIKIAPRKMKPTEPGKKDPAEGDVPIKKRTKLKVKRQKVDKICQYCNKMFSRMKHFQDHLRTHTGEKPYQCSICGSTFGTSRTLEQHMKVHTGEKPYKCNVCDHATAQLGNLQRHMRSHTNERPFLCTHCGFAFKEKNHLEGHIRMHTGEKPYECKECHRRFSVSSSLRSHMRSHLGIKPVSCQYCDKKFSRRTSLNEHIGKHLGVRIECPQCSAVFAHKRSLLSHMQIHEAHKFACVHCGKTFYRRRNLTRHLEMHERRRDQKSIHPEGVSLPGPRESTSGFNMHPTYEQEGQNFSPDLRKACRFPQDQTGNFSAEGRDMRNFSPKQSTSHYIPPDERNFAMEQRDNRTYPPEHSLPFGYPSSKIADELVNNLYWIARLQNPFKQSHMDSEGQNYNAFQQYSQQEQPPHAHMESRQQIKDSRNVYKTSTFQKSADLDKDYSRVRKETEARKVGDADKVVLSGNKEENSKSNELGEVKKSSEIDKNKMENEKERESSYSSDDHDDDIDDESSDENDSVESDIENSLVLNETKVENDDHLENLVVVKQETMDGYEEYGQTLDAVKKKTHIKQDLDSVDHKPDCVKKRVRNSRAGNKTRRKKKVLDHQVDTSVEVKVENDDGNSSDNTVIMEPSSMEEDLQIHKEKKKRYACLYCPKKFSNSTKLKDHTRTHTGERPYQCELCGSAFATVQSLKVHKRIHTGVRPYECKVCGHTFTQVANMRRHLRTHSDERPFLCTTCGFSFKEKAHLDGHMFLHTGERPFQCSICEKKFPNKSSLNTHKKIHLGIKPYKCQFCDKGFPRPYQLVEHLRIHTGNKLVCEICNHQFTHMSSYRNHMRVHEEGRKYECSKCGKKFARKRNLTRHLEMKVNPCGER